MLYRSIGDYAYLYDISPIYTPSSPLFYNVQNIAFANWLNYHDPRQIAFDYGIEIVGQYYFQNSTNGLTPVWNLTQTYGPNAIAFAMVVGDFSSPDSPLPDSDGNVDWLYLTVTSGDFAQDILRVYTNGGETPNQVIVFLSVICTARLNVAFFSVYLDQETFWSNSPHSIVSAQILTSK